jgi:hypothetical protein
VGLHADGPAIELVRISVKHPWYRLVRSGCLRYFRHLLPSQAVGLSKSYAPRPEQPYRGPGCRVDRSGALTFVSLPGQLLDRAREGRLEVDQLHHVGVTTIRTMPSYSERTSASLDLGLSSELGDGDEPPILTRPAGQLQLTMLPNRTPKSL